MNRLNNFNEIYSITAGLEKKEKGDLFEEFTYHLFKHDPRLNNNLEKIWLYKDIPDNVLNHLKLPKTDKGIDILIQKNGSYYAIQCKFRQDPNQIIPWTSLSTFFGLSFGMNDLIAGGFLVTNTVDLCQEVINSDKVVPIYGDFYEEIPKEFFRSNNNDIISYDQKFPFMHQNRCRERSEWHFNLDNKNRGYIEMACGSGKTLTAYWIKNRMPSNRTVIFVPSLQLLSQFYVDWVNQSYAEGKKINYVLIGSDADVEEVKYKTNGLILNTDPDVIKKHITNNTVVICTYQSSDKLAEACDEEIRFDLAIFDEAHKTVGQKNKQFSRMLTDKHLIIEKRLFMTATPKMYQGDDNEIVSMSDVSIYGEKIYTYNTGQAIVDKRLTDYQVLSIYATNNQIESDIKKNKLVKYKKEFEDTEASYLGIILVILKKIHDGTINHLLTYHRTVNNAKKFSEFLEKINKLMEYDDIFVTSIDGSDSMNTRRNTIREFNIAKKGIICSARVLNEGVNIPIVDSVCFVDAKDSTVDIIQSIGRCLRLCPGKNISYVIVPIFIENFNDDFDKNAFGNVIRILKALKNTDGEIAEYFSLRDRGKVGKRKIMASETYVNINKEIDLIEWNDKINTHVWKVIDGWTTTYNALKMWFDEHDCAPSEMSIDPFEKSLVRWSWRQRRSFKNNSLSPYRVEQLNKLNQWFWNSDNIWNDKYSKLKDWINKNDKTPIQQSTNSLEKSLATWSSTQRILFRKNKLLLYRIEKLNELNKWYWNSDDLWNIKYSELDNWIKFNNRLPSSQSKDEIEMILGSWCLRQRAKKIRGKLSITKIEKLQQLTGWNWGLLDQWDIKYNNLKNWMDANKNDNKFPSPIATDRDEKELGIWIAGQRIQKKHNRLPVDKIEKLNDLHGWFWSPDDLWNGTYLKVQKWIKNNKKVPTNASTGSKCQKKLASWCNNQRVSKKNNKLSCERIEKLNKLNGWYWTNKKNIDI